MKKILLATTALVISAAAANAQAVRIGGEGRMGIIYERLTVGAASASGWMMENRLQFNFSVSVQADHGLSFGAFTRARMQMGGAGIGGYPTAQPAMFSGSRVWVEANNLRLTFGNQDGAFRGAGASHGYLGGCGVGYVGGHYCGDSAGLLGRTQGFNSTGAAAGQMARLDYSFGDTRVALSHVRSGSTELGIRTTFDAFTVALGYSNRANAAGAAGSTVALSGHYNGGTWGVGVIAARAKTGVASVTNWSVSGNVEMGGGNLYGYVGRVNTVRTAGLSYGYGLGGGATLTAGIEREWISGASATIASVGVAFNF
jgi:hypothetical protein